jgi:hypothetical protein
VAVAQAEIVELEAKKSRLKVVSERNDEARGLFERAANPLQYHFVGTGVRSDKNVSNF